MVIRIKSSTFDKDSWYSEVIGRKFNVWEVAGSPFYWADFQLPIFKPDVDIIQHTNDEKRNKAQEAVN